MCSARGLGLARGVDWGVCWQLQGGIRPVFLCEKCRGCERGWELGTRVPAWHDRALCHLCHGDWQWGARLSSQNCSHLASCQLRGISSGKSAQMPAPLGLFPGLPFILMFGGTRSWSPGQEGGPGSMCPRGWGPCPLLTLLSDPNPARYLCRGPHSCCGRGGQMSAELTWVRLGWLLSSPRSDTTHASLLRRGEQAPPPPPKRC